MKTLAKAVAVASLVSASALTAQVANAEVSFNAAVVSDYVFRGFSFTDNGFALQGGADYFHESGAYAGVWASNLDDGEDTDIEYDLYAGYGLEVSGLEIDLGYVAYKNVDFSEYDTAEVYANVTKNAFTGSIYLDIDATDNTYISGAYSMELPEDLALDLGLGYLMVDAEGADDIVDMSATVSKSLEMIDVAFTVTNVDADFGQDQTLFFLTASKEF